MVSEIQRSLCYNRGQAAKAIGVSPPTMDAFIHREGFPVLRIGRRILIPIAGLERWLEEQAGQGPEVNLRVDKFKTASGR